MAKYEWLGLGKDISNPHKRHKIERKPKEAERRQRKPRIISPRKRQE